MLKSPSGSSSSSAEKTFNGVRFVLFGFDSVSEAQYRTELVRRGGTDVGRYDPSCTHVIVSGRVYDDPVCIAARKDGKVLVSELWIDDSVDFEALADARRVLYQPVKDLNGIPGCESLNICLTGYQKQEREDVMKMVSLIGARFSKPLIANQVTHLICYKFEGEKYELAKKFNIKLVNHRWLEDCLRTWEILPIDKYTKSAWELELLEAEAGDSEEETEDPGKELEKRSSRGALQLPGECFPGETSVAAGSHVSTPNKKMPYACQLASSGNLSQFDGSLLAKQRFSTPCKETILRDTLHKQNLGNNFGSGRQEAGSAAHTSNRQNLDSIEYGELSIPPNINLQDKSSALTSDMTTKMSSSSSRLDLGCSTICRPKKTPKKEVARGEPSKECKGDLNEIISNVDLHISITEARRNSKLDLLQSPKTTSVLPYKRKGSDLSIGPKSLKLHGQDSNSSLQSPAVMGTAQVEPTSATSVNNWVAGASGPRERVLEINSKDQQLASPSKLKSLSYKKRSLKRGQPTVETRISKSTDSPSFGSAQNVQETSDQPMDILSMAHILATNVSGSVVCTPEDMMLQDLHPDIEQEKATGVDGNLGKTTNDFDILAMDGKNKDVEPLKEKVSEIFGWSEEPQLVDKSENSGDIVMEENIPIFTHNETRLPPYGLLDGAASPHSRDSETRKLSSTASTSTCNGIDNKESAIVPSKKVVMRKNLGCKTRLTTTKVNRDKGIDTSDSGKLTTLKANNDKGTDISDKASIPRISDATSASVEKLNEEMEPEKTANNEKNEIVESVAKDVAVEDEVKAKHRLPKASSRKKTFGSIEAPMDPEKENKPKENAFVASFKNSCPKHNVFSKDNKNSRQRTTILDGVKNNGQTESSSELVNTEPVWFILSGPRFQRKEFQTVIRHLKGRVCRDSHNWSYQATHFIIPDPVRRTEKFFAAAAAGRWVLKTEYITASNEAGKFLDEEPFEWYRKGLTEDGAINLEAPRKWRHLRERTGHGAFYGMRIIIYGECIAPSLDTLKRAVKAGGGTILATSPPYTRVLQSGIDFAIVSPSMLRVDSWVQEFTRHEIPCVVADYLVEYVCKPGYSLEKHVLYNTHSWAEKSFSNLLSRSEETVIDQTPPPEESTDDVSCSVCGSQDRGDVMLICGDENGSVGCGIGTHIDCCNPPLAAVPEGDWFCPKCSKDGQPKTPLKSSKKRFVSK